MQGMDGTSRSPLAARAWALYLLMMVGVQLQGCRDLKRRGTSSVISSTLLQKRPLEKGQMCDTKQPTC